MEQLSLWGTLVNVFTVLVGSAVGLLLKRFALDRPRKRKPRLDADESLSCIVLKGLGLCVILFGMQGAITGESAPVIILSMALGGLIGTFLDLDGKVVESKSFSGVCKAAKPFEVGSFNAELKSDGYYTIKYTLDK